MMLMLMLIAMLMAVLVQVVGLVLYTHHSRRNELLFLTTPDDVCTVTTVPSVYVLCTLYSTAVILD